MQEHHIQVKRTARYYTTGQPTKQVKNFWIACHGYGQLAKRFLEPFQVLESTANLILAPEGLSRFYWNKFDGPPVASWMTSEDRLNEIDDYAAYLSRLYDLFLPKLSPDVNIILFGFSQGVATQMRWICKNKPFFHHLVLWGGSIPEDINYHPLLPYFRDKNIHFVYGLEDPFLTENRLDFQRELIRQSGLEVAVNTFEGKHNIPEDYLADFASQISH